jgi:hypothetical protein
MHAAAPRDSASVIFDPALPTLMIRARPAACLASGVAVARAGCCRRTDMQRAPAQPPTEPSAALNVALGRITAFTFASSAL